MSTHPRPTLWPSIAFWAPTSLLVGLLVRATIVHEYPWIHHDNAAYVHVGRMLLGGQTLYVDRIETNPPTAVWHGVAVAAVARWLGASPLLVYHLSVVVLGVLGVWFLARSVRLESVQARCLLLLAYAVLLVRGNADAWDFGEREHMFSLLFVPYLFWRCLSSVPATVPAFGVLAYLGCLGFFATMKPHFIVLLGTVEALAPKGRTSRWRVGTALGLGGASSLAVLVVHSPAAVAALVRDTVPAVFGDVYAAYDGAFSDWFQGSHATLTVALLCANTLGAIVCATRGWSSRRSALAVGATPVIAFLLFVSQRKFWSYQAGIAFGTASMLLAYTCTRWIESRAEPRSRLAAAVVAGALGAVWFLQSLASLDHLNDYRAPGIELKPLFHERQRVMWLSPSVLHTPILVHFDLVTVGDWLANFDLPHLVNKADRAGLGQYRDRLARILDREKPELVVFDRTRQAMDRDIFDVLVLDLRLFPRSDYRLIDPATLNVLSPRDGSRWRIFRRVP